MTYAAELVNKSFKPIVVIYMAGTYFATDLPDSGLDVEARFIGVVQNPATSPASIDLKYVNTAITSYSFDLADNDGAITALTGGLAANFMGGNVQIFLGRQTGGMDFADYFPLPTTLVKTMTYTSGVYTITAVEQTDRMNKPIFDTQDKLSADIDAVVVSLVTNSDISGFPASGSLKIDDEFMSYASKVDGTMTFNGITRATKGSTAAAHKAGADALNVVDITGNPLTILMEVLISVGGGGTYDTLSDGLGLSQTLIDVTAIEAVRDLNFAAEVFSFSMYDIANALKWIEENILLACNLRFIISAGSKIGVSLLDQTVFGTSVDTINEDSITTNPTWNIDENNVINVINIEWDWNEGTQQYQKTTPFTSATSIDLFTEKAPLNLQYKGITSAHNGLVLVTARGNRLISRFATPTPTIEITTHIDKSLINMGDKALVSSTKIPSESGTLNFSKELEVLSRAVDLSAQLVSFKLAYTNYNGFNQGYICPSDRIISFTDQKTFTVDTGRGAQYTVGWVMRLWDHLTPGGTHGDYTTDPVNTIASIAGDVITMENNWATTLVANQFRLKFSTYDDAASDQKRYAFISDNGDDFADGAKTYAITF